MSGCIQAPAATHGGPPSNTLCAWPNRGPRPRFQIGVGEMVFRSVEVQSTAERLAPEVLKPRRRQLGIAHRMLDGAVTEPVLNGTGIVTFVRQRVAATVAQHMSMNGEREASALANALDQAVHGVGCGWPTPLSSKHKAAVRKLPAQFAKCSDFVATKRVNAWLAILDAPDVERCGPAELDMAPFQIANLRGPEAVPKGGQDQGRVPVPVATLARLLDELLDFGRRQIFAGTELRIWRASWN